MCKLPHSPGLVREGFLEEGVPVLREVPAVVREGIPGQADMSKAQILESTEESPRGKGWER